MSQSAFAAYKYTGVIKKTNKKPKQKTNKNGSKKGSYSKIRNIPASSTIKKADIIHSFKKVHKQKPIITAETSESSNDDDNEIMDTNGNNGLHISPPMYTVQEEVMEENLKKNIVASIFPTQIYSDSIDIGRNTFKWLMKPTTLDTFFRNTWEKTFWHIERANPNYYSNLVSMTRIDQMLRENRIEFTKNLDVTSYENGERMTHNPEGRALPAVVWDYYRNGCSIRLLNPQTFIPQIHELNAALQEYFQCMTGANLYLTPPNSQGFAPHYDDIEAFVIQIEGEKRWRLYNPRNINETLPRFSSPNYKDSEIGKPILDVVLKAGDLLYFPRGMIHQGICGDKHSLHITVSVYQKHSYADLMESLVPMALKNAIANDVSFRQGLPINLGHSMGLVNSDKPTNLRNMVGKKIKSLFESLITYAPIDDAVDEICRRFQHDAMPPKLTNEELERTVFGQSVKISSGGKVTVENSINGETNLRLLRANILRLMRNQENDKLVIYYSADNSKEYHEFDEVFLEIDEEDAPVVEYLIKEYPKYCTVDKFPIKDKERRVVIATDLFEKGLLMLEEGFQLK